MAKKHVAFILDRSGSMSGIWDEVKGGYKHFIEEQQKEGDVKFSLTAFDTEFTQVYDKKPISEVSSNLDDTGIAPRGMTALLDAIGKTINSIGKAKKVMVVVFTDGYENASKEFNGTSIKSLIEKKTKDGWGFLYLGADQDAFATGSQYGFQAGHTMGLNSALRGSSMGSIAVAATATRGYFNTGDYSVPDTYEPDDADAVATTP